jgi:alanine racemase
MLAVEEVARWAGTIPYELTCAVSPRVPREFR